MNIATTGTKARSNTARQGPKAIAGGWRRVRHEVRTHPTAYGLTLVFAIAGAGAGMSFAPQLFPGVEGLRAAAGGLLFGCFCAMCSVPSHFYED